MAGTHERDSVPASYGRTQVRLTPTPAFGFSSDRQPCSGNTASASRPR
jgi:hypothetical protein